MISDVATVIIHDNDWGEPEPNSSTIANTGF